MDGFFQIYENEICIPGAEKTRIMHISDSHLCIYDALSSEEERKWAAEKDDYWMHQKKVFAGMAGEYFGPEQEITTREAFLKLISYAEDIKPDLLLLTGDNLERMHPAGERFLREILSGYSGRYIILPGNHEEAVPEGCFEDLPKIEGFNGFSIIVADDRLKTVDDATVAIMKQLADRGEPVIVATHIPLCTSYNRNSMDIFDPYFYISEDSEDINAREFVRLIRDEKCFAAVLCGHVHGYSRTELAPGKLQICSSQGMIGAINMVTVIGK